ncbi:hypothetical protein [Streptomyces sp. NPDC058665]|uniref:hypothetical protein n=1 Tax=Streptomyces sp. NPDC058665 TaxID=3346586 RepID=UPI0036698198
MTAVGEIEAVAAPPTEPVASSPAYDDTPHPPRKRVRRVGWVLGGVGVCCAVVLGAAVIGGGSAPPWLSIPGVAESDGRDPANTTPAPVDSVSGAPEGGPGRGGEPGPGETRRSVEAVESTAGARSGGSGSAEPLPSETGAVSPSATSGSPSAPGTTTPPSPSADTGTPTPSGESSEPPSEDPDPLGGLLGGLFGD